MRWQKQLSLWNHRFNISFKYLRLTFHHPIPLVLMCRQKKTKALEKCLCSQTDWCRTCSCLHIFAGLLVYLWTYLKIFINGHPIGICSTIKPELKWSAHKCYTFTKCVPQTDLRQTIPGALFRIWAFSLQLSLFQQHFHHVQLIKIILTLTK